MTHTLLQLLQIAHMTNLRWHSIPEDQLEGSPGEWRSHGYVRVWPATPVGCKYGPTMDKQSVDKRYLATGNARQDSVEED